MKLRVRRLNAFSAFPGAGKKKPLRSKKQRENQKVPQPQASFFFLTTNWAMNNLWPRMFMGGIKLLTSQEKPLSILTEPSIFTKRVSDASSVKMPGELVFFLFPRPPF